LVAGVVVLAAYLIVLAFTAPNACGFFGDDATYAVTAKALAEGHGYRRIDLPGEPHQTKYPVLYPFILSLVWRAVGDYPANLPWLRVPNVLFSVGAVVLGVCYVRRNLPLGKTGMVLLAVLALSTPELRLYSYFTMSEPLFALLATASLLLGERAIAAGGRRAIKPTVLCGVAVGLACLSRSIGLTLIAGMVIWTLCRRRFVVTAWIGSLGAVFIVGWWAWVRQVATTDQAAHQAALLQYELDYSAWVPGSLPDVARVITQNLFHLAYANFGFILRLPDEWLRPALADGGWALAVLHAGVWICLAITLVGYLASARARVTVAHVFLLVYLCAVLAWPFEPLRFLAPIFVFAIGFQLLGWAYLARWLGRRRLAARGRVPAGQVLAAVAGLVLTGFYLAQHRVLLGFEGRTCRVLAHRFDLGAQDALTEQIRQGTPTETVIAAQSPAAIYLATGRKAVDLLPNVDPVAYGYSSAGDWRTFYAHQTSDEVEPPRAMALDDLTRAYDQVGVGFQIITNRSSPTVQAALAAHRTAHPDRYRLVYRPADGKVAAFEVLREDR
jgi:hypothetical protein